MIFNRTSIILFIYAILTLICTQCLAQAKDFVYLKGQVLQQDKTVAGAIIVFSGGIKGTYQTYTLTNNYGKFTLTLPYDSLPGKIKVKSIQTKEYTLDLNKVFDFKNDLMIQLIYDTSKLEPIEIRAKLPIKVKGDTTIFDVKSFTNGNEHTISSVLEKLPGFQVDENGNIKYNGKRISKVLFDYSDLSGSDYQQLVKKITSSGLENIEVIDNYIDDDDLLASDFIPKRTVINLNYSTDKKAKIFGEIDLGQGIPLKYHNYNSQMVNLKAKSKWILLGGANNTGSVNSSGLKEQTDENSITNRTNTLPKPLAINFPTQLQLKNALPFVDVNSRYLQFNFNKNPASKWRIKSQTSFLTDAGTQRETQAISYFLPDTTINQTESFNENFKQYRINSWWRISRQMNNKNQILLELKYFENINRNNGIFSFQQINGNEKVSTNERQIEFKAVLNRSSGLKTKQRTEMNFVHKYLNSNFSNQYDSIALFPIFPIFLPLFNYQNQNLKFTSFDAKHILLWGKNKSWVLETGGEFISKQQHLNWVSDSNFLKQFTADSLNSGSENRFLVKAKISKNLFKSYNTDLSIHNLLIGFFGSQKHSFLGYNSLQRIFAAPGFSFQHKFGSQINFNVSGGFETVSSNWNQTLGGIAFLNRTTLFSGIILPEMKLSYNFSAILSMLKLSGKSPSIFMLFSKNSTPLFVLPNLFPGVVYNRINYLKTNNNLSINTFSLKIQSPLSKVKFNYDFGAGIMSLKNYNIISNKQQEINFRNYQLNMNIKWQPINKLYINLNNQFIFSQQRIQPDVRTSSFLYSLEAGLSYVTEKKFAIEIKNGLLVNTFGNQYSGNILRSQTPEIQALVIDSFYFSAT